MQLTFGGVAEWQTRLIQNQVPSGSGGSTPLAAIRVGLSEICESPARVDQLGLRKGLSFF
jgi:hypothetical protein